MARALVVFGWVVCAAIVAATVLVVVRGRTSHDYVELFAASEHEESPGRSTLWQWCANHRLGWTRDRVYWSFDELMWGPDGNSYYDLAAITPDPALQPPTQGWTTLWIWSVGIGEQRRLPAPPVPCFGPRPVVRDVLGFSSFSESELRVVTAPTWSVGLVGAGIAVPWVAWRRRRRRILRRGREGLCLHCGYDVRASLMFGRCPECGRSIEAGSRFGAGG